MKSLKKRNRLSQNARSRGQWEIQVKVKITLCGNLETFSEYKFCPLRPCENYAIIKSLKLILRKEGHEYSEQEKPSSFPDEINTSSYLQTIISRELLLASLWRSSTRASASRPPRRSPSHPPASRRLWSSEKYPGIELYVLQHFAIWLI